MLASNPPRNSRPEWIVDDGKGEFPPVASYSLDRAPTDRRRRLVQVYQQ
jgi:hypothetical protein